MLPPDGHVHTEWSADAVWRGSMERSCARAVELGLPSIAFTEHVDFTRWVIEPALKAELSEEVGALVGDDGKLTPPPLDVEGYLACVQRCRERYPDLRILTGMELGEPHWHDEQVSALLSTTGVDRALGSLHSLELGGMFMVDHLFHRMDRDDLMRSYLAEALKLAESTSPFAVLAHIDYPVRHWPADVPFDAKAYEDEYRAVLGALARSGRALELNTVVPLQAQIVRWWHEAGGEALAFGSDAHRPESVGRGLADAAELAEAAGFHPGRYPHDYWRRKPRA